MKQQTAVEWLVKELKLEGYDYTIQQAKEMEENQIKNAFYDGKSWNNSWDGKTYYNEMYLNKNSLGR